MEFENDVARKAIRNVRVAGESLGLAKMEEQRLEDERCTAKRDAIVRIMQSENPLTGKAHSASSAEAVVETDAEYAAYRKSQRQAVLDTQCAFADYEAAKLTAQLEVALIRAQVSA